MQTYILQYKPASNFSPSLVHIIDKFTRQTRLVKLLTPMYYTPFDSLTASREKILYWAVVYVDRNNLKPARYKLI